MVNQSKNVSARAMYLTQGQKMKGTKKKKAPRKQNAKEKKQSPSIVKPQNGSQTPVQREGQQEAKYEALLMETTPTKPQGKEMNGSTPAAEKPRKRKLLLEEEEKVTNSPAKKVKKIKKKSVSENPVQKEGKNAKKMKKKKMNKVALVNGNTKQVKPKKKRVPFSKKEESEEVLVIEEEEGVRIEEIEEEEGGGMEEGKEEIEEDDEGWVSVEEEEENTASDYSEEDIIEQEIECVHGEDIGAVCLGDSRRDGQETFLWMIAPHTEEEFFRTYWEKQPLHIKRGERDKDYFTGIFSTADLDTILKKDCVLYTKNLDITSYSDGVRETHNPVGRAHPPVVWDYYNNGCSVRMLNPQTFHTPVQRLLYTLQEYFNCFCGANVYLTPPNTQGFAPHWDDIEAFILQLEGRKRWRVYRPRSKKEELPVHSSKNLGEEELGPPVLEVTLSPGDVLYFPRGFIHQAEAADNLHSLHITVSTYQCNTWGHYLQKVLPQALTVAMEEDVEFRRGLPRDYLDVMGIVNMDNESPAREAFIKKAGEMVMQLLKHAPLDSAADQCGTKFLHDALPPLLIPDELACTAREGGERWNAKTYKVENCVKLDPSTHIRLIRGNCIRVVVEGEGVSVYHCLENSLEYHGEEPQYLEVTAEMAPGLETLLRCYPRYTTVRSLPLPSLEEKMALASGLWERGLLVTANPLSSPPDQ